MRQIRSWWALLTGAALLGLVVLHPDLFAALASGVGRILRGTIALARGDG